VAEAAGPEVSLPPREAHFDQPDAVARPGTNHRLKPGRAVNAHSSPSKAWPQRRTSRPGYGEHVERNYRSLNRLPSLTSSSKGRMSRCRVSRALTAHVPTFDSSHSREPELFPRGVLSRLRLDTPALSTHPSASSRCGQPVAVASTCTRAMAHAAAWPGRHPGRVRPVLDRRGHGRGGVPLRQPAGENYLA
jgi:hypothetical protein